MTQPPPVLDALYDADIERHVLASLLLEPDIAGEVIPVLTCRDFYLERNQHIFDAISHLWHNNEPLDTYGLVDELRRLGYEEEANDLGYLVGLLADNMEFLFGRHHANRLINYRRLRDRLQLGQMIADLAYQGKPPDEIDARVDERLREWGHENRDGGWLYGWESIDYHNRILAERRHLAGEGMHKRFDWPWPSWNRMVRPLRAGLIGLLAAPDGVGKSTYLAMIAEHWAANGNHVNLVHLEDDHDYKLDRRLARYSKLDLAVIEDGLLSPEQEQKRQEANQRMAAWADRLHYLHAPGQTARQVIRELEARRSAGICDAVVIDYLDKFQPDRRQAKLFAGDSWERQADDMETIKSFAERLHLPVFTATQGNKQMLNGGAQSRQNIQGSGQKSHKSQLVMILTRDLVGEHGLFDVQGNQIAKAGQYSPIARIHIDKQNRGQTGDLQQYLRGDCFLVADLEAS